MTANELLGLIPRHVSSEWSAETKGDHQLKKRRGEGMFKLTLLFSMLHSNRISLCAGNGSFAAVFSLPGLLPSPASLQVATTPSQRDRISVRSMHRDYFDQLFKTILGIYNK